MNKEATHCPTCGHLILVDKPIGSITSSQESSRRVSLKTNNDENIIMEGVESSFEERRRSSTTTPGSGGRKGSLTNFVRKLSAQLLEKDLDEATLAARRTSRAEKLEKRLEEFSNYNKYE